MEPKILISYKLPDNADAVGQWTTLWIARVWTGHVSPFHFSDNIYGFLDKGLAHILFLGV